MVRVVKLGGYIVFDCYDETTMEEENLISWLNSIDVYPVLIPNQFIINFFNLNGFFIDK